jgi:hypothetical protein
LATFVNDTCTDTANTALASHTGETGATWTQHANWSGVIRVSSGNRLFNDSVGNGASVYVASGSPAGADYEVQATVRRITGVSAQEIGIFGRMSAVANTWYWARYSHDNARWELFAGISLLGTHSQTLSNGTDYVVKLEMIADAIKVYVDGVQRISATDATYSAAGKAGVFIGGAVSTDTTGYHLDNISATDVGGGPALSAGTASVTSYGLTVATVTSSAASGGTSPYTYQWQRSTSSGSGFSNVSGATSLTLNDTGLTRGTTYYYRCVQTDSAAASVTTNEISLTTRTKQLVIAGNSQSTSPDCYAVNGGLGSMLGATWQVDVTAIAAQTTRDMSTGYASQIGNYYHASNTLNLVVIQEVMNDIYFGQTGAQAYANLETLCESAKASGFKVMVLLSQPDRNDFPGSSTLPGANGAAQRVNYQTYYADFLALFQAGWRTFCDGFVNPFRDSRIVVGNNTYILTADDVHWSTTTDGIIASMVTGAVEATLYPSSDGGSGPVPMIGSPFIRVV